VSRTLTAYAGDSISRLEGSKSHHLAPPDMRTSSTRSSLLEHLEHCSAVGRLNWPTRKSDGHMAFLRKLKPRASAKSEQPTLPCMRRPALSPISNSRTIRGDKDRCNESTGACVTRKGSCNSDTVAVNRNKPIVEYVNNRSEIL
jgi:hypothetical protein